MMNIALFIHWSIFEDEPSARSWIEKFIRALELSENRISVFNSETDKIAKFDLVHIFSRKDAETWASIYDLQTACVVTPALTQAMPEENSSVFDLFVKFGKTLTQRRWPPIDESTWWNRIPSFVVIGEKWDRFLQPQRVLKIPPDPEKAARAMLKIYEQIIVNRKPVVAQ